MINCPLSVKKAFLIYVRIHVCRICWFPYGLLRERRLAANQSLLLALMMIAYYSADNRALHGRISYPVLSAVVSGSASLCREKVNFAEMVFFAELSCLVQGFFPWACNLCLRLQANALLCETTANARCDSFHFDERLSPKKASRPFIGRQPARGDGAGRSGCAIIKQTASGDTHSAVSFLLALSLIRVVRDFANVEVRKW